MGLVTLRQGLLHCPVHAVTSCGLHLWQIARGLREQWTNMSFILSAAAASIQPIANPSSTALLHAH